MPALVSSLPVPAAELVGYLASVLVAISLTMANAWRLRVVNLAGAVTFAVYGALVRAWPVLAVNLFIAGVNVWFLRQMARRADLFSLFATTGADGFVQQFLRFHDADLRAFFPRLDEPALRGARGYLVLRNLLPVGLILYREAPGDGDTGDAVEILVDYVIRDYRDHKNAEFVFRALDEKLAAEGRRTYLAHGDASAHQRYLLRMGFHEVSPGRFERRIG